MKKILILLIAGSVMLACNNKKEASKTETKTEEKTTTPDNTQVPPPVTTDDNTTPTTTTTTGSWSTADENRFMRDCESTAEPKVGAVRANEYCDCMLQKIKGLYKSYMEADRGLANDEAAMDRLANECNGQQ